MKKLVKMCVECGNPVYEAPNQDSSLVRTCGPRCARSLAVKEHPDLDKGWSQGGIVPPASKPGPKPRAMQSVPSPSASNTVANDVAAGGLSHRPFENLRRRIVS